MAIHHQYHHQSIHHLLLKELSLFFVSMSLRWFSVGLLGIFIPLYFLNKLSLPLSLILVYYGAIWLFWAAFVPFAAKIALKLGLRWSIFLATIFEVFYFLLIFAGEENPLFLIFSIVAAVLAGTLFYVPYHIDFAKLTNIENRAKEVSLYNILIALGVAAAPLTGGLVLSFFGFPTLFVLVVVLLLFSLFPLFLFPDRALVRENNYSPKNIFLEMKKDGLNWRNLVFGVVGADMVVYFILWSITIYYIIKNYSGMGVIFTISLFLSTLVLFYVGNLAKPENRRTLLKFTAPFYFFAWLLRAMAVTIPQAVLAESFAKIAGSARLVPFDALNYDLANEEDTVNFVVKREIAMQGGKVLMVLLLLLLLGFGLPFQAIFVLVAFLSLAILLF